MNFSFDHTGRYFFDAMPEPAYVVDPETGTILAANVAAGATGAYQGVDLISLPIERVKAGDAPLLAEVLPHLSPGGGEVEHSGFVLREGRKVAASVTASFRAHAGAHVVVAMVRLAEEGDSRTVARQDAGQEPATAPELASGLDIPAWRALIDATSNPMVLFDRNGHIVVANRSAGEYAGLSISEVEGRSSADIYDRETAILRQAVIDGVVQFGSPRTFDEKVQNTMFRVWAEPVKDVAGNVLGVAVHSIDITDYVAMQKEVIEKERFYAGIINAIQDGVEVVDAGKRVLLVNRTFSEWFGHLGPLQGREHKAVHGESEAFFTCPVDTVLETGKPAQVVRPFRRQGVEAGWLEVFSYPLMGSDGGIRGAVQYCRDITEKVLLERRLYRERRRFREYYDVSPVGIATVTPVEQWLDVNMTYCQLLGYTKEELLKTSWAEVVHPDDHGAIEKFHKDALAGNAVTFHGDIRYIHRSGTVLYVTATAKYIRDEEGTPGYFLIVVQDIGSRREAEEELRKIRRDLERRVVTRTRQLLESESNLRALLNAPVVSSFLLDVSGRILAVNDVGAERLSYAPADMLGRQFTSLFPPKLAASRNASLVRAREQGRVVKFQDERDGLVFDISVYPVRDRGGEVSRLAVFAEDVTKTRTLERQLLQAQKMEALGIMAGGIAHDFNNILGVIITNAELLQMDALAEKAGRRVSRILDAGTRARDVVKQILTFSRSEMEERTSFDLGDAITAFCDLVKTSLPENIELSVERLQPCRLPVNMDLTQLQQMLMNLCVNARHAIGEEGGVISVQLDPPVRLDTRDCLVSYPELSAGSYARISVQDTGQGIEPAIIERIFEPFFTTKPKEMGTGLGLSMVHGIIRRHAGAIRVQSEPGNGAVFTVFFPLHEEALEETALEGVSTAVSMANGRILFVDDDAEYRSSVLQALERIGYEVDEAGNGLEALGTLIEDPERYGLVLTDQTMPGMSGLDFAECVRARNINTPILLCTGYSQHVTEARLSELGLGLLLKPFTVKGLEQAIINLLHNDTGQ
ncbi:hypothetical protein DQK91_19390 [Oceanidesulfovibrio marinus]|uniref:histidine kinase n=1 Tax=Oceanidesulfovibrio marinus TaxID=370038 RepID=A0A6P1ZCL9_9BACT|nr:hypothetical protein DQK91_19390 [Oceanidesulfovibrio marinus]